MLKGKRSGSLWIVYNDKPYIYLIIGTHGEKMERIMGSLKTFTSRKLKDALKTNPKESRKEWLLMMMHHAGKKNSNNNGFQFWQQDNHPIEPFSNEIMDQKLDYINNNPV